MKGFPAEALLVGIVNESPKVFLLVEDQDNDVELAKLEFAKAPFPIKVCVATDGSEAIEYIEGRGKFADRKEYPIPHVILLDLKMPRLNGFDFLKWLRTASPDSRRLIPVVMMSTSSLPEDIDRAYALGANSYLVKPVEWPQFKEQIKALGVYWAWHSQSPQAPHR